MTIQGLLAYYYRILHPGDGRELRRCVFALRTFYSVIAAFRTCMS